MLKHVTNNLQVLNKTQIFLFTKLYGNIIGVFMKISQNFNTHFPKYNSGVQKKSSGQKDKVSFGSIYIEDVCNPGEVAKKGLTPQLLAKDALLLNDIAKEYPNQDCFIRKGFRDYPRLEYREKPPEVQVFTSNLADKFKVTIDPDDDKYPSEPLIIYENDPLTMFIGLPSFVSLNPSLPYTVKAGYEVHKKLLEKKIKIEEAVGKNDIVDFGDEPVIKKAHKAIEDIETAVIRYLMECSYAALTDKADACQLYASNYPKVQSRLADRRIFDLTTSVKEQDRIKTEKILEDAANNKKSAKTDICETAMNNYPNLHENKARIKELSKYMMDNSIYIF